MLFTQNPELLKNLVSTLLAIPLESIEEFVITNSDIPPENIGEKFCRLDITMIADGNHLAIEIQVEREEAYSDRLLYYWAREYSSALPEGGDYAQLPRTVIISIIDFIQFKSAQDFHSEFRPLEVTRHEPLSDKMSLHFFELRKLPAAELNISDKLMLWLSLFKADTEEEIAKIKALKEPVMEKAINAYEKITVTPEFKERERQLHYARLREATALRFAREEGMEKGREEGEQRGKQEEREVWQGVVAGKDTEIAGKDAEIARLKALLEKGKSTDPRI
jgi:predicted transposase/invertase (TIGR01784 family)